MIDYYILIFAIVVLIVNIVHLYKSNQSHIILIKNIVVVTYLLLILMGFVKYKYAYLFVILNLVLDYMINNHMKRV